MRAIRPNDSLSQNLHMLDIKNKHRILRHSCKLRVAITQMWTRPESASAANAHPLKTISETGNSRSVSDDPNLLTVSGEIVSTIELTVVSELHTVALL